MLILGIETSCDETSVAIVENGTKILSNVISSSQPLHEKTGGIIPEAAAREQVKCIISVLEEAISQSYRHTAKIIPPITQLPNYFITNIDAIAVTIGPGLIGSLLVGVETAKTLAILSGKPLIPINHILAHIYANWLYPQPPIANFQLPDFPAIALVVSGGHTELFLMESHHNIQWIGGTRDDAAGECFDKSARLMGLGYPGGPAIAKAALQSATIYSKPLTHNPKLTTKLPRPMMDSKDYYFSFSGLKTAVLREVNNLKIKKEWNSEIINYLSYEVQEAITDVLVAKTINAAREYKVKSILVGGGVAANKRLKEKFLVHSSKFNIAIPPVSLCTDNAAYIAGFAYFHNKPVPWQEIQARPDLEVEV